jgi:squalene cyclase
MLSGFFSLNQTYYKQRVGSDSDSEHSGKVLKCLIKIRKVAVECLEKTDYKRVESVMMQLIQALRYENYTSKDETGLVKFIIDTAIKQGTQAFNTVHWALMLEYQNVEDNSQNVCEFFKSVYDRLIE